MRKNNELDLNLEPAELTFQDAHPYSDRYGDHYFAREGGFEESHYVFIRQNGLPQRWQGRERFVIAETGFGTGLNFLATAQLWLRESRPDQRLHYVSFEKHLFRREDLQKIHAHWADLGELSEELLDRYPPLLAGMHRLYLYGNRVVLTLCLGDVKDLLPEMQGKADAWYLDGFAPSKNPGMWNDDLFSEIARHSKTGTTFATFTAAGFVRRGLQNVGFAVEKFSGYGAKREMLRGSFTGEQKTPDEQPWFCPPDAFSGDKQAIVVGAGIAGVLNAFSLASRGWKVTLIERNAAVAQEGSGNPLGLVAPHLGSGVHSWSTFNTAAFLQASAFYQAYDAWQASGVLQIAELQRFDWSVINRLFMQAIDKHEIAEMSGLQLLASAVFFPQAGMLNPQKLCRELLDLYSEHICVEPMQQIESLAFQEDAWLLRSATHSWTSSHVILTNAVDANRLLPHHELSLHTVRGQLSYVESSELIGLKRPLNANAYILPIHNGANILGATFQPGDSDKSVRESDHQHNLDSVSELVGHEIDANITGGRTAFRAATRDHLPIVSAVYDPAFYRRSYDDLYHGRPARLYLSAQYLPGLYLNVGHGSHGLTNAVASAELIADTIEDTPRCLSRTHLTQLHSARFLIRRLKRKRPGEVDKRGPSG
ncbi:MAG: bifunctional tRNA (5-methylaminomethyl-2-thiouridine)(34)-methyltransferase MnmD/FAD-dependent 5-carboxymethylaminomethyl-2-thiouridine(34) oxidoreductase MnmC [Gammaproteobacteria bacterium]|nr:bifunctional tRNA (5-methylaminomethyl-2-thiouridine)(34)-methyltransferase MnmD/FAD-dependent 5-carboxymethylaminomethyl-2-thiouridine(34) oxidoreductase MnmC [Gammaproteobacteria bacterium]